jgi:hypothetical protein
VPFVLKAGKALNERKAEIRVQLRSTPHFVFGGEPESMRNEVGGRALQQLLDVPQHTQASAESLQKRAILGLSIVRLGHAAPLPLRSWWCGCSLTRQST